MAHLRRTHVQALHRRNSCNDEFVIWLNKFPTQRWSPLSLPKCCRASIHHRKPISCQLSSHMKYMNDTTVTSTAISRSGPVHISHGISVRSYGRLGSRSCPLMKSHTTITIRPLVSTSAATGTHRYRRSLLGGPLRCHSSIAPVLIYRRRRRGAESSHSTLIAQADSMNQDASSSSVLLW